MRLLFNETLFEKKRRKKKKMDQDHDDLELDTADLEPAKKKVDKEAQDSADLASRRWRSFHHEHPGVFEDTPEKRKMYLTLGTLTCIACAASLKVKENTGNVKKHIAAPMFVMPVLTNTN